MSRVRLPGFVLGPVALALPLCGVAAPTEQKILNDEAFADLTEEARKDYLLWAEELAGELQLCVDQAQEELAREQALLEKIRTRLRQARDELKAAKAVNEPSATPQEEPPR